ncbi:MAG: dTDP-4-dehydrorhamnose 3,5-epimerase [bacterium]
MNFIKTSIPNVILIEPKIFNDSRGCFFEIYNKKVFSENGIKEGFVQDNHSRSAKGSLRGLHYQEEPISQAKLVRVIKGEVFDIAVDIRRDSTTFGKWVGEYLSEENRKMLYIPIGFAHGFLAMRADTELLYKVSNLYSPQHERGIIWNDPKLAIKWPDIGMEYLLSEKDKKNPSLNYLSENL